LNSGILGAGIMYVNYVQMPVLLRYENKVSYCHFIIEVAEFEDME
jgi:hypothetical protein